MSQESVEVMRAYLEAFATRGVDGMAEFWDPDINYRAGEGAVDDVGEMNGKAQLRRYLEDWVDTFDGFTFVAEELRPVGDERVVAVVRIAGRAKLSGAETELRFATVYDFRDGKMVRGREYWTLEEALEAARLG